MRTLLVIGCIVATLPVLAGQPAAVKTISHGEAVELKKFLDPDKNTIVEFYADW